MEAKTKDLIKKLEKLGLEPYSYSGRGMYGERCVAVNFDSSWDVPDGLPGGYSQDSMGLGVVIYWTHATWPQEIEA